MPLSCDGLENSTLAFCEYVVAEVAKVPLGCNASQYLDTSAEPPICVPYLSPAQKAAGLMGPEAGEIDSGNTAWILAATALVMIMTPGLGLFYAGMAGEESASNTILMSFVSMALVTTQWFLFGYSFAFGPGTAGWGSFEWGALVGISAAPSAIYGGNIPHVLFVAFQCMFAQLTPALISGAIVGRMKFSAYVVFILLWTTLIYDPVAHWVWSLKLDENYEVVAQGFLGNLGALDFAGGAVIHVTAGFGAVAAALVVGKRQNYGEKVRAHNVPLVILGVTLLWFGWFGFNAGSAGGADGIAAQAFLNTQVATAAASFAFVAIEAVFGRPSPVGAANGAVVGLVAITPACGFVSTWGALLIGLITVPFCYGAIILKGKLGFDDTLDCFPLHGVGGFVGALLTGLFADPSINSAGTGAFYGSGITFAYQLAECLVAAAYSFVGTGLLLLLLKFTIGLRVSEEAERDGIDLSEHGAQAYGKEANKV